MEGISGKMRRGLKKYWGKRRYQKLNGSSRRKRNTVKLGGATGERKRKWRIRFKVSPKIRIPAISSPKRVMVWMRDAYVRMMMRLANSRVVSAAGGDSIGGFGRGPPPKEYDDKMIIHMYKSLIIAQGQLVPPDLAAKLASQTACQTRMV